MVDTAAIRGRLEAATNHADAILAIWPMDTFADVGLLLDEVERLRAALGGASTHILAVGLPAAYEFMRPDYHALLDQMSDALYPAAATPEPRTEGAA